MAAPNDTRILTEMELEEYAKDYHNLEDLSHFDFSNLDFDSDYFRSLPPAEQYSILNAARLRSRLRMGYSKEQLDDMFPDRLAFSRFQIQRLKERNDYTQRLMNLNGMNDTGPQRIAGEKGREYFLVRNEGVEGGWVLGTTVIKDGEEKDKPVLLDVEQKSVEDEDVDGEFEDVPLEVSQEEPEILKVIPQLSKRERRTGYGVQTKLPFEPIKKPEEALFVADDEEEWENVPETGISDEDQELQAAIKLSMESSQPTKERHIIDIEERDLLGMSDTDDSELNRAIALSLEQHQTRPPTSNSADSDLRRAIALSRDDFIMHSRDEVQLSDGSEDVMIIDTPSSYGAVKDKGKGKAVSPSSPTVAAEDENFLRAIELSKAETSQINHPEGVGTSKAVIEESPSRTGLGRSMFRKKQPPPSPAEKEVDRVIKDMPATNAVRLEIPERPVRDKVLEEKIREASPVAVPNVPSTREPSIPTTEAILFESMTVSPEPPVLAVELTNLKEKEELPQPLSPSPEFQELTPPRQISHPAPPTTFEPMQSSQDDPLYLSEDEDEELMAQLAAEEEEHARFASQLNPNATRSETYNYTALHEPLDEESFEKEMRSLRNQQKKDRRDADEVNQLMVVECQQLLRLFGLPYVTAPMEAEAQCAELVKLGLVDGIVTDDSDIFLFGGTRVYKNMFNQGKFVECYLLSDLERDFNLDRNKFINLAHLLGSDYAEGIPQVGPVNALELLSEFPGDTGLEEFRDWWIAVQQGRAPRDSTDSEFRKKFRKNSTKIFLPNDFPNRVVDQAYLNPDVDHDPQGFVWGVPDLDALRSFLMSQIGWSKERTDEILVPVIKDMNRRQVCRRVF